MEHVNNYVTYNIFKYTHNYNSCEVVNRIRIAVQARLPKTYISSDIYSNKDTISCV